MGADRGLPDRDGLRIRRGSGRDVTDGDLLACGCDARGERPRISWRAASVSPWRADASIRSRYAKGRSGSYAFADSRSASPPAVAPRAGLPSAGLREKHRGPAQRCCDRAPCQSKGTVRAIARGRTSSRRVRSRRPLRPRTRGSCRPARPKDRSSRHRGTRSRWRSCTARRS
jgi:hypothetical protein